MDDHRLSARRSGRARHRRGDAVHRPDRARGANRVRRQRPRRRGGTRRIEREAGFGLRQRPRVGGPRRAHPVRGAATGARCRAGAGRARSASCQRQPEQRRRILEAPPASPACTAAATRRRLRSRAAEDNLSRLSDIPRPARLADREPQAASQAGAALQGDLGRDPQARGDRLLSPMGGRARARSTPRSASSPRRWKGSARHRGRGQGDQGRAAGRSASCSFCASGSRRRAPSLPASGSSRRTWNARCSALAEPAEGSSRRASSSSAATSRASSR